MNANNQTFILIRGLWRERRHWGEFISILQNRFPDANIIALDVPGNGLLNHQTSPNTISGLTDALRQQLADRNNLTLIALSMGGMIGLDWMSRYPDEIKSAILINTSARPHSPFFQRLRWQCYPEIIKTTLCSTPEKIEKLALKLTSNFQPNNKELLNSWLHFRQQNPVSKKNAFSQLLASAKFSIKTPPQKPLLIVYSKNDHLVDYHCSLKLHQLWHTDYKRHETAGHDVPLDDPKWLAQVIYQWVNSL